MTIAPAVFMLLLAGPPAVPEPPGKPIVAQTGEPVLLDRGGEQWGVPLEKYREKAEMLAKATSWFIPMRRPPEGLGNGALFGWNLKIDGKNVSWALDSDRRLLIADTNANGDLTDDTPLPFRMEDGRKVARFRTDVRGKDGVSYPVEWKLVLREGPEPNNVRIEINDNTIRKGTLRLGDREMLFGVRGSIGQYGLPAQIVYFDLDGDGQLRGDDEAFRVSERYVTVGKRSYEFKVDRYGRSLTLQPLAEYRPPRPRVAVGAPAPGFAERDLDGRTVRLDAYRGKVVLLDFWSIHCGPCVAEAPKLAATYRRFKDRGFEVIGINEGDEVPELKAFIEKHQMPWPQIRQAITEGLGNLYKVQGLPTYFLIGRDGKLVAMDAEIRGEGGLDGLEGLLEKHLGK
jgi:peroxiredoxin